MQKRIEYIDIVKGVTIFLVVIGHIETVPIVIKECIYSFHMPLFFLLSGFFFREDRPVRKDFIKLTKSLLIPYFFVAVIMRFCCLFINVFNDNPVDFIDILSIFGVIWICDGEVISVGAIWFLMVLFWSKLYLNVILRYHKGPMFLLFGAFVSICLTKYFDCLLPFGLQQAAVCSLFVYIGLLCRKFDVFNLKISTSLLLTIALTILPFSFYFSVGTRVNGYRFGVFSVLISSAICVIVVWIIKKISEVNHIRGLQSFFVWSGKYSIVILAVHSIESRYISASIAFQNFASEIVIRILFIVIVCWLVLRSNYVKRIFNVV